MRILIIHQNFPGQFRHVAKAWSERQEHQVVAIGHEGCPKLPGVRCLTYKLHRQAVPQQHHYLQKMESAALHGHASGIGRRVNIDFDAAGLAAIPRITLTPALFAAAVAKDNQSSPLVPELGIAEALEPLRQAVADGTLPATVEGKPVIYGTKGDDSLQGTRVRICAPTSRCWSSVVGPDPRRFYMHPSCTRFTPSTLLRP